ATPAPIALKVLATLSSGLEEAYTFPGAVRTRSDVTYIPDGAHRPLRAPAPLPGPLPSLATTRLTRLPLRTRPVPRALASAVTSDTAGPQHLRSGPGRNIVILRRLSRCADVAQLVEHHLAKVRVAGSNPVVRSIPPPRPRTPRAIGAAVARFPDTEEVTGSIPVSPTTQGPLGIEGAFVVPRSAQGGSVYSGHMQIWSGRAYPLGATLTARAPSSPSSRKSPSASSCGCPTTTAPNGGWRSRRWTRTCGTCTCRRCSRGSATASGCTAPTIRHPATAA